MKNAIVIGGEKGGTGKTTTSINLAIMEAIAGKEVVLIDADKQRSSAKFFDRRNGQNILPQISCVNILGKNLHSEIDRLASKFDSVIIDVGGRDSVELRSSLIAKSVSHWYSPIQPTDLDMDTLETLNELTSISLTYNPNLITKIILNGCSTHVKIKTKDEAKEIIDQSFEYLGVCNTSLGHRVAYQYSISNCKSVVEFEADEFSKLAPYRAKSYPHKASNEIIALYNEIMDNTFQPLIPEVNNQENIEVA